jgi:hypothetical protein
MVMGALLLGCAPRTTPNQIQEAWFACGNDRECVILEDPRCTLIPIHRRYARSFADWVRLYRAQQVTSRPCSQGRFRYEAICEERRCSSSLVRPGTEEARDAEP